MICPICAIILSGGLSSGGESVMLIDVAIKTLAQPELHMRGERT